MAIAQMNKVMIVCHQSQAEPMLERIQQAGMLQILDAERAMVTKEWPELMVESRKFKEYEDLIANLSDAMEFLKIYCPKYAQTSIFTPLKAVDPKKYNDIIQSKTNKESLGKILDCKDKIDKVLIEINNCKNIIELLLPWKNLKSDLADLTSSDKTNILAGIIPNQNYPKLSEKLAELNCAVEIVSQSKTETRCVVVTMKSAAVEASKAMRNLEFEQVNLEIYKSSASQAVDEYNKKTQDYENQLNELKNKAQSFGEELFTMQVLYDYYSNLLHKQKTKTSCPATDNAVIFEGWVKEQNYKKLESIVSKFDSANLNKMPLAEGEDVPVDIDNNTAFRPFESITRLYGMPQYATIDPTAFLAPFFAIFFGLCLNDAGYGLLMVVALWWFVRKMQGDKKMMIMLLICGVTTFIAGALTGSWFGDAISQFVPSLDGLRRKIMLFDPLEKPMIFFGLCIAIGYFQIIFGICIAFVHNIINKRFMDAIYDQLTWLVMLNCIVLLGISKAGLVSPIIGKAATYIVGIPAIMIVLFSQRNEKWGARLGMGVYQLFSTVFYFGDVLSYVRLMALGMVGSGFGMAINVITKLVIDIPYVGYIMGAVIFVGGHLFNVAMSALGAFVHSLRLQFIEFFPKFFTGGGSDFLPFRKSCKYTFVKESN